MSKKKPKKKARPTYNVTAEAFVDAWTSSSTIDEVVKKTGLPRNAVYSRVNSYRKKKVVLPKMQRPRQRMDIEKLNQIAETNLKKKKEK